MSFVYPGPSPSLKGAGDNDLPVKGVVDLEFKVGKTKITMKRVVVVGIPLNVISTYWGGPPLGVQILYTFPTPKMGIKQIEQFSDIILCILRFLAESSGVTKLKLFQPFPHCK